MLHVQLTPVVVVSCGPVGLSVLVVLDVLGQLCAQGQFLPLLLAVVWGSRHLLCLVWPIYGLQLLFPSLFPLVLCVLKHLLSPQVEEVRRISVKFETLFTIVPVRGEDVQRRGLLTRLVGLLHRDGQRGALKQLLVLNGATPEGLPHGDVLK